MKENREVEAIRSQGNIVLTNTGKLAMMSKDKSPGGSYVPSCCGLSQCDATVTCGNTQQPQIYKGKMLLS